MACCPSRVDARTLGGGMQTKRDGVFVGRINPCSVSGFAADIYL